MFYLGAQDYPPRRLQDRFDDDPWARVFRINVTALMRLTRAVVPLILDAGTGTAINVASEAGLRGSAAGAAYTASKHAVVGLTKNSAVMYGPLGLRFNAVAPGPTITNIVANWAPSSRPNASAR